VEQGRSEEEVARARLAVELERLRRGAEERAAQRKDAVHATVHLVREARKADKQEGQAQVDAQLKRTLKVCHQSS
jgi:hypothetical protein